MKNIFNKYYPADCSRKTRQAFITKAKRGKFIGLQAPYGFKKSPEDKHVLIIDEKTAPTVKWIFKMAAYQGYGYNKIALVLTDRKVITPAVLQAKRAGRGYGKDPYDWNLATVFRMTENTAYLGHLTSGKRRKISFKSKRIKRMPEEKWIVNKICTSRWFQNSFGGRAQTVGKLQVFEQVGVCEYLREIAEVRQVWLRFGYI